MEKDEIKRLKQMASDKTGVPAEMITGETVEEIAASAVALSHFKKEHQTAEKAEAEKRAAYEAIPTRTKFASWFNGEPLPDPTPTPATYPNVPDAGEVNITIPRDASDAFKEWFNGVSAFDPRKERGEW